MKLTLAIVAVLAMGGAASAATGPYTGPNQPTAQGPQYVVPGADIYEWSTVLGYAVPICDVTGRTDCRPLDVNIVSGGSGGGGGWSGGSTSAPGYVSQVIGGVVLSASNPSDDQLFYNGSAVSGTNGLPTTDTADGSPATAYNYPAGGLGMLGLLSDQRAVQALILAAENSTIAAPGSNSSSVTGVQGVTGGKPVAVSDPANAAFSTSTAITPGGASVAAGRTLQVDCSTGGAITMTLSGGGSAVLNVVASAQSQFFPFAVTAITASTATGTYHNLN